jgi:hypothetical protein
VSSGKVKRIDCNSVTETLAQAMEHAEEMKNVVVLYETKDEYAHPGGMFTQKDMTLSTLNWLFDLGKSWLLGSSFKPKVD